MLTLQLNIFSSGFGVIRSLTAEMSFELYRQTKIGDCLCDVLEEMCDEGKITQELAMTVFKQFDASILAALETRVQSKASIKAALSSYRFFDNVWQFTLKDVSFKLNMSGTGSVSSAPEIICEKAKVVCVDAKLIDQPP